MIFNSLGARRPWTSETTVLGVGKTEPPFDPASLFSNGEQGFAYDISKLTNGSYGANQSGVGQPVIVGVADAAEYNTSTSVGSVYRADLYNQSIVNFDVDNAKSHELIIENTGSNPIAVNADLAMGTVLFTVSAGQTVTRIIDPVQVIVITSANEVSKATFKVRSLKEFAGSYTMYQDAAGAVPVTGVGQPVGLIKDKSGRNNHAYQTDSASRPILRKNAVTGANYLEFDGSDDFLQIANIDFSATDKMSLFTGVRKNASSVRILCELSSNMNSNSGSFYLTAPETGQGQYGFKARANANQQTSMTALTQNTSIDDICVLSASSDLSADRNTIRRNGLLSAISYDLGTGNFGNYPLFIGRRSGTSLSFNGHIYSLICVGRLTTDSETKALEKEIAKRVGVTINV